MRCNTWYTHCHVLKPQRLYVQEKRAAAAKAQQLQQPQGGSGSTPASGAASPSPMETTPSGGVDRASSDAAAVAAAAMARTKSQGKANAIIFAVALAAIDLVCNASSHKADVAASCMISQLAPMCSSPSICYIDLSCQTNEVLYCQCCSMPVVLALRMALTLPATPVSTSDQAEVSLMLFIALKQVQRTLWVQAPARALSLLPTKQRL